MGIPTDILKYFHPDRRNKKVYTYGDFLDENMHRINAVNFNIIIKRLLNEGYLIEEYPRNKPLQTITFDKAIADYGVYDFVVGGFQKILETFKNSVFCFVVKLNSVDLTNGTGFLLDHNNKTFVITAKHNINKKSFQILSNDVPMKVQKVWSTYDNDFELTGDSLIDVAVIEVNSESIQHIKPFQLNKWEILDEVLTIGYPPIEGFDNIQFAETAAIAALKSTKGEITSKGLSHIDRHLKTISQHQYLHSH